MELAPAGLELSFEVTFDRSDLYVGMIVYDTTPSMPLYVLGPVTMQLLIGFTYVGKFTPGADKAYVIEKAVYTDPELTTLDPNYSQGSESIFAMVFSGGGGGNTGCGAVVGIVDSNNEVTGLITC